VIGHEESVPLDRGLFLVEVPLAGAKEKQKTRKEEKNEKQNETKNRAKEKEKKRQDKKRTQNKKKKRIWDGEEGRRIIRGGTSARTPTVRWRNETSGAPGSG
jgi:hypothetical protein